MHTRSVTPPAAATALALLLACGADTGPGQGESAEELLRAGNPQRFLVLLDPAVGDGEAEAAARGSDTRATSLRATARAESYARTKRAALADAEGEVSLVREYRTLPVMHVELRSAAALDRLRTRAGVAAVVEDAVNEAFLAESLPLIHQPGAYAAGAAGAGTAVAVLDTGVDYTRAAFGACASAGAPGCRVIYAADFAPEDSALDAMGHGSNVAGIVAGVAPGAGIISLDVFNGQYGYTSDILAAIDWCVQHRQAYNIVAINMSLGGGGSTVPCGTDAFAGAVHAARAAGIVVVASSGNAAWTSQLASPACTPDAVSVGAVYDSAMGGRSYGACSDATTAADQVTCFSNSASFLTLLAPGAAITAAGVTYYGTSQAAPHVAGAVAVVRGANPALDADETITQLRVTGVPVTDPRNGVQTPRVDLADLTVAGCPAMITAAMRAAGEGNRLSTSLVTPAACGWTASSGADWLIVSPTSGSGSATLTVTAAPNPGAARSADVTVAGRTVTVTQAADRTAPTGSVAFADGGATRSRSVTLALQALDPNGVPSVCVSNGSSCSAWRAFAGSLPWTLASGGSGTRKVYVRFRDGAGNVSPAYTASIVYDVTGPTGGKAQALPGNAQVSLSWSGFKDANTQVASYVVNASTTATPATACTSGVRVYQGVETGFLHAPLTNGATYLYRVCPVDLLGNVGAGVTASARPAPEFTPPVGSLSIHEGAAVRSLKVNLDLAAADDSGVSWMCVTNSTSCNAWRAFATSLPWTLASGGSGTRTVRVWFRDAWGNTSAAAALTTVKYDVTPPSGGAVTAVPSAGQVALSWAGFKDGGVGMAGYQVVAAPGVAPASCSAGLALYAGPATSLVHQGVTSGVWGYRVCGVDLLGNTSKGVTKTVTVP